MYEKEIQFIVDYNLNKVNNLGSSFTFEKLTELDIHPAIIRFISGTLDYLIYQDRKTLLENSAFDYSGVKISEHFNQINEELKKTKKLSIEQIKKLIEKAVTFNTNFTTRPIETLTDLIFRNEDSKEVAEIKVYLNCIYYYDYLRDVLNSYFARKKIVSIKRKDFETTIKKINDELLLQKSEMIISDAIDSITDFYNEGAVSKSSVPINFIEAYFKAGNLDQFSSRLNKAYVNGRNKAEISELKEVLFPLPIESINEQQPQESMEEENLVEELEEMNSEKETPGETEELVEEISVKKSKFEKDLFSFLNEKETEKIISIIFNDDGEDFTSTIEKLEECDNYDNAAEVLKKVFSTYKIDPFNREAVALTDAVSDYFSQAD